MKHELLDKHFENSRYDKTIISGTFDPHLTQPLNQPMKLISN